MAFNPFNLFKGNPKVLELMTNQKAMEQLLLEQSFVSEFKKSDNDVLQAYMNYQRYEELIRYITTIQCNQSNKNRAFKFPYVSSEILAINNDLTYKFLLEEVVFTEDVVEEEVEVQKEIDSESSDRSYSSIKSSNSSTSKKEVFENKPFEEEDKENFVIREENDKTLAQFDFKDERDICQEDFPDVKQKKIVLVKEVVKRTVKRPYQPLVFKLLRYFEAQEVIHILDGYVCRVLDSIFSNRFLEFLQIVDKYQAFNSIKRVFSHLQSNSVQETLLNFINRLQACDNPLALSEEFVFIEFIQKISEIPCKEWPSKESVLEEKAYILGLYCSVIEKINGKLVPEGDKNQEKREYSTVKAGLKEICKILRPEHIAKVITNLGDINSLQSSFFIAKLTLQYCKLSKLILKSYSIIKNMKTQQLQSEQLEIVKALTASCEDCFDPIIHLAYNYIFQNIMHLSNEELARFKSERSLISKMEFIEIMGILAKENVYFSRRTIIDDPRFGWLLKLLDLYPKSSIFHNGIMNILLPFFSSNNDQPIIKKLLEKRELFVFMSQVAKTDLEMRYQKKGTSRKCYISQLASICQAMEDIKLPIVELNNYRKCQQWLSIKQSLIQDEQTTKKILGGHEKARDKKPQIYFSKEDCLKHFAHFLSGSKLNTFDDFQNYQPQNSDSEDQQQSKAKFDESLSTNPTVVLPQDNSRYFEQDYIL